MGAGLAGGNGPRPEGLLAEATAGTPPRGSGTGGRVASSDAPGGAAAPRAV